MLKQRIITALILLPVVLLLFFMVELQLFTIAISFVIFLVALEWARLAGYQSVVSRIVFALSVSLVNLVTFLSEPNLKVWPSFSWPSFFATDGPLLVLSLGVVGLLIAVFIVFTYSSAPNWWANKLVRSALGLLMLPALFVALVSLRKIAILDEPLRGGGIILYMFCLIWAADTGAYFTGKALGKTKLAPVVSPNKTWEGVVGGILLSVIIAWIGANLLNMDISNPGIFTALVIFLAGVSVIGDLFESALKRVSGIKDSGDILPGHGGLLDRLDSTIAVAPVFFLLFTKFGWI